jgi:hypothetical protein
MKRVRTIFPKKQKTLHKLKRVRTKKPLKKEAISLKDLNISYKIAWELSSRFSNIQIEELLAESRFAYSKAIKYYSPKKGSKSTYIYKVTKQTLHNYIDTEVRALEQLVLTDSYSLVLSGGTTSMYEPYWALREELSPLGQEISDIIINNPELYVGLPPKLAIGVVNRELRAMGWKWTDIWRGVRELKAYFRN